MNKLLLAAILFAAAGAFAQDAPTGEPGPNVMMYKSTSAMPVGPVGALAGGNVFFSAELPANGKPVTGAPYSANVSTETTQVLSDGNRIVNKTTASLARDSQGRTRREETMGMVGPWQVNGPKLIFINDPTSQTNYVLDADRQTATVLKLMGPIPPGPQPGVNAGFTTQSGPNITLIQRNVAKRLDKDLQEEAKTESLGVQMMEGVSVEGKRVTRTIPAGQIGNLQPITTTSEVWFSPDLQAVVMSKHSDPRFGETYYQLTGIQRAEPDHSLFEVPSGYTIRNLPAPMPPGGAPDGGPFQFGTIGSVGPNAK